MKTILVDAVHCFVSQTGQIFDPMYKLLETYPNKKILLTGADDSQFERWSLDQMPYEVFTLKHNPEKTDPKYYRIMLDYIGLTSDQVVYFEHNLEAAKSAQSVGIVTHIYDTEKKDLSSLKEFLDVNLKQS